MQADKMYRDFNLVYYIRYSSTDSLVKKIACCVWSREEKKKEKMNK